LYFAVAFNIGNDDAILKYCDETSLKLKMDAWNSVERLIEEVCVERVPSGDSYHQLHPRAKNSLRSKLFKIAKCGSGAGFAAFKILLMVETVRLRYGKPQDEYQHPDVEHYPESLATLAAKYQEDKSKAVKAAHH
jgi:hypothetical protein